jgi:hypothetical protein
MLKAHGFTVISLSTFVISTLFFIPTSPLTEISQAATCVAKACIDVYTQDGQIVIEGKKGSGPAKKAVPSPTKPKVVSPRPATPKPTTSFSRPAPPRTTRPVPIKKKKSVKRVSLSDRLVKLLPLATIAHQPTKNALIHVPMIFWCDLPSKFATKVSIVGEVIDVAMRPSFVWSFGDGSLYATISSGAPYPKGGISHSYRNPGRYVVALVATWGGTWTFDGVSRSITGEIHKTSFAIVDVAAAPTVITK